MSPRYRSLALATVILAALPALRAPAASFIEDLELRNNAIRVIEEDPNAKPSLAGSFLAAQVAAQNYDEEAAAENYRRAIELDPDNVSLKQSLFMALTANGDIGEAIKLLDTIPVEAQDKAVNHVVTAAEALKQKSWKRAVQLIDNVTGTDLDNMLGKLVGSWALFGAGDLDGALARADEIGGPDWTAMIRDYHKGLMLAGAGRDQDAIPLFETAIANKAVAAALTETYMRAIEALARSQARTGERQKAIATVEDGLGLLPGHDPLKKLRAQLDGEEQLQPLISAASQGGAEVFYNVGSAISRQGGQHFAQSHMQIAHFLEPDSDLIQYALANIFENQDKFIRANDLYSRIGQSSPFWRGAQLEMAVNLDKLDQFGEAEKILSNLFAAQPDDIYVALTFGGIYVAHDKFAEAATVYTSAISRISTPQTQHWTLFYRRGISFERTGQWEKAEADFRKALELSPDQADVLNYLGYSMVDMGKNLDEGVDMIRKAVELKPNSGYIIDSLGWAYYRLGRYEEAVEELEKALELMPGDPVINDHLGDAYWMVGRKLEATFQWRHALASKPAEKDEAKIREKLEKGLIN